MSSAFPKNSSIPPEPIEIEVEEEFAFLSTLVEAVGTVNDVPSPRVLVTVPKETASIRVPVFAGSFLIPTLLLLLTVSAEDLSQVNVEDSEALHHK